MIVGRGLLADAFRTPFEDRRDVVVFASGVSNSGLVDPQEYAREQVLLEAAIRALSASTRLLYFGTCSVYEVGVPMSAYKAHKLRMERLVLAHPNGVVLRLPQVAGKTRNAATLLNYLALRLVSGETIYVWRHAQRNVIDVDDVVAIASAFLKDECVGVINVANPQNVSALQLVELMAAALRMCPKLEFVEAGGECPIDLGRMQEVLPQSGVRFGDDYLPRVLAKYYASGSPGKTDLESLSS